MENRREKDEIEIDLAKPITVSVTDIKKSFM